MSAKLCETCDYWRRSPRFDDFMQCVCPKMLYGYGLVLTEPDQVMIEDDESWGMYPGPKFGCVHHKIKDPNADTC